ncbi:hypothetical protein HY623_03925 [Candidatus Uhrbacteria bacterium]|nr:hypothetical protein [Candidatus Uhrbacteria bacterium]
MNLRRVLSQPHVAVGALLEMEECPLCHIKERMSHRILEERKRFVTLFQSDGNLDTQAPSCNTQAI